MSTDTSHVIHTLQVDIDDFQLSCKDIKDMLNGMLNEFQQDTLIDKSQMTPSEKCTLELSQLESKTKALHATLRKIENAKVTINQHQVVFNLLKQSVTLQQHVLIELQKLGIIE